MADDHRVFTFSTFSAVADFFSAMRQTTEGERERESDSDKLSESYDAREASELSDKGFRQ